MDILIAGTYKVQRKLGKGSFGVLYQGINIKNKELVAIKFERHKSYNPQLEYEYKLYQKFSGL
jgi:serine/threonine protein kinase